MVHSRLRFARNFILAESSRLRSSQPRKAAKRYMIPVSYTNRPTETTQKREKLTEKTKEFS